MPEGTTVGNVVTLKLGSLEFSEFFIKVNSVEADAATVLHEGDTLTVAIRKNENG